MPATRTVHCDGSSTLIKSNSRFTQGVVFLLELSGSSVIKRKPKRQCGHKQSDFSSILICKYFYPRAGTICKED